MRPILRGCQPVVSIRQHIATPHQQTSCNLETARHGQILANYICDDKYKYTR